MRLYIKDHRGESVIDIEMVMCVLEELRAFAPLLTRSSAGRTARQRHCHDRRSWLPLC